MAAADNVTFKRSDQEGSRPSPGAGIDVRAAENLVVRPIHSQITFEFMLVTIGLYAIEYSIHAWLRW